MLCYGTLEVINIIFVIIIIITYLLFGTPIVTSASL